MPQDAEDYVHRIGRTARAGAAGQGDQPGGRGGRARARAHREVHQPEDPRGLGRGRALPARDQAHQRGASPLRRGEARAHGGPRRRRRAGAAARDVRAAAAGVAGATDAPPAAARAARLPPPSPLRGEGRVRGFEGEGRDMTDPHVALRLPDHERALLPALVSPWRDLLYAPGPGFTSPLDPGAYRTSIVIVPAAGPAIRVSSVVMPAFGGEICRLSARAAPARSAAEPRLVLRSRPHRHRLRADSRSGARDRAGAGSRGVALRRRSRWRPGSVESAGLRVLRERGRGARAPRGRRTAGSSSSAPTAVQCPGAGGGRAGGDRAVPADARPVPGRCSTPRRPASPGSRSAICSATATGTPASRSTIELHPLV